MSEQQRLAEQIEQAKTALMTRPNDPFQRNRLGNLYRQAGRLDEAIVAHKRVIALGGLGHPTAQESVQPPPVLAQPDVVAVRSARPRTGIGRWLARCHRVRSGLRRRRRIVRRYNA